MASKDFEKAYVEGLQALVSASAASEKSAGGYGDAVSSPELKKMLKDGSSIAKTHTESIQDMLRKAGGQPSGAPDKVMAGIIAAGEETVGRATDPHVKDAAVVATVQVGLHYYIAAYGSLAATAKHLGKQDDVQAFMGMNEHMKQKDAEYTQFVEQMPGN